MPSSRRSFQPRDRTQNSHIVGDSVLPGPPGKPKNTGVSGQPIPSPGGLPDPGIEPGSLALQVDFLPNELPGKPIIQLYYKTKNKKKKKKLAVLWGKKVKVLVAYSVQLFTTPWTIIHLAPLSMEFSRQEYWSGLPFPSPGDLPNPGNEPGSLASQADSLPCEPPEAVSVQCDQLYGRMRKSFREGGIPLHGQASSDKSGKGRCWGESKAKLSVLR